MKKIFNLFDVNQKKNFYNLIFLMTLASLLEMFSLATIIPILNSFLGIKNNFSEFWIFNFFEIDSVEIITFLYVFLIFFILKILFLILVSWKHNNFVYNFVNKLSSELYTKYLYQNYEDLFKKNSAELLRNILKETDVFYLYLQSFTQIILESIILIGILLFLLYLIPIPTLIVGALTSVVTIIYYFLIKKNLFIWGKNRQKIEEERIRFMQESFASIKEINFFKRNNYFLNRFKIKNSEFYKLNINFNFLNSLPRLVFELFTIIMLSIVFIFLILSGIQTQEIIKIVALFFAASFRILPSIYRIFTSMQNLKYTYQALKTLHFDYQSYKNNEHIFSNKNLEFNKKVEIIIKEFSYKNDSKNFKLENVALEIKKNQNIGIIGKSGSGKSTLLNVFSGILFNKNISLKVDDKIICKKNDLNSWQKKIGLIPQNITILDDTLKKNILFGLDPSKVSQEDILKIIKISNLSSFLSKLPDGLEQHVSEKGINFSGGELQRIAIARALIFNPEILIFDEATSALDTFTENEILNDVNNLPNKTIIMISHRINTLKFCDKVILIEEGKIKSQGSFNNFRNY